MVLALIAILIVFFAFGSQMALNYIAARTAYACVSEKQEKTGIIIIMIYLNIWILDTIISLFKGFDMTLFVKIAITEIIMYGLTFIIILIMSYFSKNESKYITIPATFTCCILAIPAISFILNFINNIVGIIIV